MSRIGKFAETENMLAMTSDRGEASMGWYSLVWWKHYKISDHGHIPITTWQKPFNALKWWVLLCEL